MDKAPANKGVGTSGVGSNATGDGAKSAIRAVSEKNHPCGTTAAQTALRGICGDTKPNTKMK